VWHAANAEGEPAAVEEESVVVVVALDGAGREAGEFAASDGKRVEAAGAVNKELFSVA
jgi:hypothetical protein